MNDLVMGSMGGPRGLALCAGGGGLELGLSRLLRGYKTLCYVEGEAYAASVLVSHMEKGRLHPAPIWSNVRTFDPGQWVGQVDCISGGFPCQPFSKAGSRRGEEDPRHLWPDFVRIIGVLRPRFLFLENVAGVVNDAGASIANDLASLGYDFGWTCIEARAVGAPHRRNRWFCFAEHPNPHGGRFLGIRTQEGLPRRAERRELEGGEVEGLRYSVPNTKREGLEGQGNKPRSGSETFQQHLDPVSEQCRRNEDWWSIEPNLDRMVDGVAYWVERMRLLGNGVVPQQAEAAYRFLMESMGVE